MSFGVLIVDDDVELRSELADMLEGYDVVEAGSGDEALGIISSANNIDAVVLDIRMPGIDGLETLRRIKKIAPELGVIIFTGFSTKDAAVNALKNHADDYLEKPADIDRLGSAVENVIAYRARGPRDASAADPSTRPDKIKRFLERNSFKKTTLNDAAGAVFLSPKYLSRYFKDQTGQTFSGYKLDLKMKKAKKLLSGSGLTVDSISRSLGYSNVESFSRIFSKREGMPPSAFRKKHGSGGN